MAKLDTLSINLGDLVTEEELPTLEGAPLLKKLVEVKSEIDKTIDERKKQEDLEHHSHYYKGNYDKHNFCNSSEVRSVLERVRDGYDITFGNSDKGSLHLSFEGATKLITSELLEKVDSALEEQTSKLARALLDPNDLETFKVKVGNIQHTPLLSPELLISILENEDVLPEFKFYILASMLYTIRSYKLEDTEASIVSSIVNKLGGVRKAKEVVDSLKLKADFVEKTLMPTITDCFRQSDSKSLSEEFAY